MARQILASPIPNPNANVHLTLKRKRKKDASHPTLMLKPNI